MRRMQLSVGLIGFGILGVMKQQGQTKIRLVAQRGKAVKSNLKHVVPLIALLFVSASSYPQHRKEPVREATGSQVLTQLDVLIIQDKIVGKSKTETLSLVESIVALNKLQIQFVELTSSPPDSLAAAFSKDNSAFRDLRASICKQRPHLTQLIELEGKLKSCEQN